MITKRGFMKWLLSTSTLVGIGGVPVGTTFGLPLSATSIVPYTAPSGVKRFTVRMMGGGGGGGSAGQNLTGGRGGIQ